jgi:Ca2+-binding EF-hand superfamily protein
LTAGVALGQAEIDTDGDGMVSYTELLLVMPDMTEEDFTALDANEDGMLDAEEFAAAEEAGLITMG